MKQNWLIYMYLFSRTHMLADRMFKKRNEQENKDGGGWDPVDSGIYNP